MWMIGDWLVKLQLFNITQKSRTRKIHQSAINRELILFADASTANLKNKSSTDTWWSKNGLQLYFDKKITNNTVVDKHRSDVVVKQHIFLL